MPKTILITGSTDGIGLEAARLLASLGHHVLLHGRNPTRLEQRKKELIELSGGDRIESFVADLSDLAEVEALARAVIDRHGRLDVLINNAGVFTTPDPVTKDGLDARFAINTVALCLFAQRLLPPLGEAGRIVNLSSTGRS